MREGWEIRKLEDACDKQSSNVSQNQLDKEQGQYPIYGASGLIKNVSFYHQDKPYLSIVKDGSGVGRVTKMDAYTSVIGTLQYLLPKEGIDLDYLYYSLMSVDFKKYVAGAAIPHIYYKDYKNEPFLWMPLSEQKGIVEILDETSAAIDKAKANVEKNLQNAKELFESYLKNVFSNKGENWEEKRFDNICVLQRGFDLPTHSRNVGNHPLVSSNGITDKINLWKVKAPGVVTGRSGTIGNVHYIESDFWPLNTALYIKDFHGNNEKFIYYFLKQFDLSTFSSGAGVPTLNRNNVHGEKVWFPKSMKEQQQIVNKVDDLSIETEKLEAIYQQKLNDLEELKKSILQKAFSGELTARVEAKKLFIVPKISTTDLQAGIIVIALQRHLEKNKHYTFHHVKAEKIINTIQYHLAIELERNPIKDAAGPNDFQRLKFVESRASKAGFFYVKKQENFYDYFLGNQSNKVAEKVKACLAEKVTDLNEIIDAMIPMDTQQAEIFATAYAAWNNLLIDGLEITDEAIVFEARENWHSDKLNIPRDKFFKAIEWIRKKGLTPKGVGKRIMSK